MSKRDKDAGAPARLGRRAVLKRLGIAATASYMAPVMLNLSTAAASSFSGGMSFGSFSAPSGPSRPSAPRPAQPRQQPARQAPPPPPRELVVLVPDAAQVDILAANGFEVLGQERIGLVDAVLVRLGLEPDREIEEALRAVEELVPNARVAENALYRTSELPCGDGQCAAFDMIGWQADVSCEQAPRIGMIDAGINPEHAAFDGRSIEVISLDLGERDAAGRVHGTAIAALLVGRPDSRTPGLMPNASLLAVEAFHADGQGDAADVFSLVRALDVLAERDVSVINMSFAGPPNAVLADAVQAAAGRDIALVAAAGNEGPRADPLHPAALDPVIAVTAVGRGLQVYRQAGAGPHIAFAAPGVQIWTAASVSGGRFRSGTSYAAPFVTAAIASARLANPDAPLAEIMTALAERAEDLGPEGHDETFGWGLVQADQTCPDDFSEL